MRRPWTPEECEVIAAEYVTGDLVALARRLDRTVTALKRHAQKQGFKRPRHSTKGRKLVRRTFSCGAASRVRKDELFSLEPLQQVIASWFR